MNQDVMQDVRLSPAVRECVRTGIIGYPYAKILQRLTWPLQEVYLRAIIDKHPTPDELKRAIDRAWPGAK